MAIGSMMFLGMFAVDMWRGVGLTDVSMQQLTILGARYGLALILIKGVSMAEISDIIRAFRGK